MLLVALI